MTYIKGKYSRSIYTSDNGYHIGLFRVQEASSDELSSYVGRTITFTGYFPELNDIDNYIFYGKLVQHNKYGEQFQVDSYERVLPDEDDSMITFLTSSLFKGCGVGKAKATKIVKTLGKDTLKVILENPNDLLLIPTISEKNATKLHNRLKDYETSYDSILYLTNLGFSAKEAAKIYNYYKDDVIRVIEDNIYTLIDDINGMSFKRIDNIYLRNNDDLNNINRLKAVVIYILNELTFNIGYSYFSFDEISSYIPKVLGYSISNLEEVLKELEKDLKLINYNNRYYLYDMFTSEELIVNRVNIINHNSPKKISNLDKVIKEVEEDLSIKYNSDQKEAIRKAISNDFLIITGGPGTGKTTIIRAICEVYRRVFNINYIKLSKELALLSPTGRAAKRISEKTNYPASTIHRFLKWNKETDNFSVNEYNQSDVKMVIIDEFSMVDTYLFANLLKGLKVDTKIIIIGDDDQLPSVGPGEVLKDMLDSNKLNYVKLNKLYRQSENSNIIKLAYDIKREKLDESIFNTKDDLTFINSHDDFVMDNIIDLVKTYRDLSYQDLQVLIPIYKSYLGIDNANNKLQAVLNRKSSNKKEITIGDTTYRENDKVIQLINNPDDNVFNGDIGIIKKIITRPKKEIIIDFDGNLVSYKQSSFNDFKLAYAISIHKAQGTETDIIILPIVRTYSRMLYKKLIYTAVTRAKKKLFIIGDIKYLHYAVNNNKEDLRRTSIKEFLTDGIKQE